MRGGELLQHVSRRKAWGQVLETMAERDMQAIGQEGDEDVRFNVLLMLVIDRPDRKIPL